MEIDKAVLTHEVKKYTPEQTLPENALHPPTEVLRPWIIDACIRLVDFITGEAFVLAEKKGFSSADDPNSYPLLRIGGELELFMFGGGFNPVLHSRSDPSSNPNYTPTHKSDVERMINAISVSLKSDLQDTDGITSMGRLGAELRTGPTNLPGYIKRIGRIIEGLEKYAKANNIRVVIHSQHLHLSLTTSTGDNLLGGHEDSFDRDAIIDSMIDAYHRGLPMCLLPNEVDDPNYYNYNFIGERKDFVRKGMGCNIKGEANENDGPLRLEGRLNNSEYMFDPYLTLFVNLQGMHRGLHHLNNPEEPELDTDYPLNYRDGVGRKGFRLGSGYIRYVNAVEHMREDQILIRYLGESIVDALANILLQYPDVSTGDRSVKEVREQAYRIAEKLKRTNPPQQYLILG